MTSAEEIAIDTPQGIQDYLRGHGGIQGVRVIRNSGGGLQMSVEIQGKTRSGSNAGEEKAVALDSEGDLLVAQGLPAYVEMSRLGSGFSAIATSAVAALIVRPSTTALFTLWNGEAASGKSYVIDRLLAQQLVSAAPESRWGIWACVHPPGMAAPGIDIARAATNLTGYTGNTYDGQAQVGVDETVVNNGWYPWGNSLDVEQAATLGGGQADVRVEGRLIIPPSGGLSLHVVASSVNEDFAMGCSWYEAQLKLL